MAPSVLPQLAQPAVPGHPHRRGADAEQGRGGLDVQPDHLGAGQHLALAGRKRGQGAAYPVGAVDLCGGRLVDAPVRLVGDGMGVGAAAQRAASGVHREVAGDAEQPRGEVVVAAGEVHEALGGDQPGLGDEVLGGDGTVTARPGAEPHGEPSGERLVELSPRFRVPYPGPLHEVRLGSHLFVLQRRPAPGALSLAHADPGSRPTRGCVSRRRAVVRPGAGRVVPAVPAVTPAVTGP